MSHPSPHPAHRPYSGNAQADPPLESARKCLVWGWCLIGGGCLLALVPFLGILVWFVAAPLVVTGFVLAIVAIAKGRTAGGLCLLLFSLFVAPFALVLGPVISSLVGVGVGAAAAAPHMPSPQLQEIGDAVGSSSPPTTEAEMAAERDEIQRQLDSKDTLRR